MMAHPMRCVKLTLPPRVRAMWLLITIRLSIMSLAGIVRTLVAVGTVRDSSMFAARAFGIPLRAVTVSSDGVASEAARAVSGACAGIGWAEAGRAVVRATGWEPITGVGAVTGCASSDGGLDPGAALSPDVAALSPDAFAPFSDAEW